MKQLSDGMGIGEIIGQIRAELIAADKGRRASGEEALFHIGDVDIELKFVVREREGDGMKLDFKVIAFNDQVETLGERTHTITVRMRTLGGGEMATTRPLGSLQRPT